LGPEHISVVQDYGFYGSSTPPELLLVVLVVIRLGFLFARTLSLRSTAGVFEQLIKRGKARHTNQNLEIYVSREM
jgi:hypothetical protein